MAEEEVTVLSTVVLPGTTNGIGSPASQTRKRRASSTSSTASKRLRLDSRDVVPEPTKPALSKRTATDADERTRGRRLFGGLLGTLSQKPSSTTHRRRVDIEQKQRDKLKVQKEEDEEVKRKRSEQLNIARRARQKIWEAESTRIKQDNRRALAGFLRTKAEPVLYYKPWELLPEEELQIREQIEEVEKEFQTGPSIDVGNGPPKEHQRKQQPLEDIETNENGRPPDNALGDASTNQSPINNDPTPISDNLPPNAEEEKVTREEPIQTTRSPKDDSLIAEESHASPDATKDGLEEMVQGDEDAVLY